MIVQNKGNFVRHAAGVTLIPGANEITEEQWEAYRAHPLASALIKKGEVEAKETFGSLSAADAIDLAKDTFDMEVLEQMKLHEKRTTVLKAIDEQISELQQEGE
ncbi:hypothetical protein NCCP2716_27740 [Sporosarcina sp. NCCP-2716]|uniref:hypothetical protein n=1 Tax=Sporosarcina sp. NCCP-2716 TaxID=2943679 RepID=UPI00203B8078|nr:hypothetical protein [Sporosarcina sp. NCCP-2716]GKV70276.1 hypothetical protein NCCP2716_27740 [Sporosarcina sp. NCCP-2716]